MKSHFVCILCALVIGFTSCHKDAEDEDDNSVYGETLLVKTITDDQYVLTEYEYDDENRLTKISASEIYGENLWTCVIEYGDGKDPVKETHYDQNGNVTEAFSFVRSNHLITTYDMDGNELYYHHEIDDEGFIIATYYGSNSHSIYSWTDGNLTKLGTGGPHGDQYDYFYTYDRKRAPFSACTTSPWFLFQLHGKIDCTKNNCLKETYIYEHENIDTYYDYAYNENGYPEQWSYMYQYKSMKIIESKEYTYIKAK